MNSIRIDTTEYERSHGRRPRGNGNWMFRLDGGQIITGRGTLTKALAQAKAAARELGACFITVMP